MVDVYYGNVKPQKAFEKIGLYVSLFPQLIAGPIVRYTDIEKQMENRVVSVADLSDGLERFFMGLSKKVLLADKSTDLCMSLPFPFDFPPKEYIHNPETNC